LVALNGPNNLYTFDFSTFIDATAVDAYMCVKTGTSTYMALECVTVGFEVTASPADVPANNGQVISVAYPGYTIVPGDQLLWRVPFSGVSCPTNFTGAREVSPSMYSNAVIAGDSDTMYVFDFEGMRASFGDTDLVLCVNSTNIASTFTVMGAKVTLTPAVVGVSGDPHVRAADGAWHDFYGEAGVYQLYQGAGVEANAKFGYAVRDRHMIWHPETMRPGTMMEEIGIRLLDEHVSIRLGVYGQGVVSIREALKPTQFWTAGESKNIQIGKYEVHWAPCTEACLQTMPWGTHERSRVLTVQGEGELMQFYVSQSGGYKFIDLEAIPGHGSTGLLADASMSPQLLSDRLRGGLETEYKLSMATLPSV